MLVLYKTLRLNTRIVPFDETISLCEAFFAVLQHEKSQKLLIDRDDMDLFTSLFLNMYNIMDTALGKVFDDSDYEPEQVEQIGKKRRTAAELIDTMVRRPDFLAQYPPDSDLVQDFASWLSMPQPEIQMCACQVLGELSSNEERATKLFSALENSGRINDLLDLLRSPPSDDIASIGLRLLKNLALPQQNKLRLATKHETLGVIMNLCCNAKGMEVRILAVQVLKAMMFRCYQTAIQFLWKDGPVMKVPSTNVARLLSLYHEHREQDGLALRMEIARFFGGIFRVAHLTSQESGNPPTRYTDNAIQQAQQADLADTNLAVPLCALITDSNNQSLVTEGWASLVLAAGTDAGAEMLLLFFGREPILQTFQDIISNLERDSHDWNNALALRSKLLTYCVSTIITFLCRNLAYRCYAV